jgi:hypothetical protein
MTSETLKLYDYHKRQEAMDNVINSVSFIRKG